MPMALPAIAAWAASAVVTAEAAATAASIVFTVAGFGITAGMVGSAAGAVVGLGVSALMSPRAKTANGSSSVTNPYPYINQGTTTTTRDTIAFAGIIYGEMTTAGSLIFEKITSSGVDNLGNTVSGLSAYLNRLVVFAYHECDSFVNLYLDNNLLTIDGNGWVTNAQYTKNSDTVPAKTTTTFSAVGDIQTATGSGTTAVIKIASAFATASTLIGVGDLIQVAGLSDPAYNGQFLITAIATSNAGASTQLTYTTDTTISQTGISQAALTLQVNAIGWRGTTGYVYDSGAHGLVTADKVFISQASPDIFNIDKTTVVSVPSVRTFTYQIGATPTQPSLSGQFQRRNGTDQATINIQTFLGAPGQNIGGNKMVNTLMPDVFQPTDLGENLCSAFVRYFDASQFTSDPVLSAQINGAKLYDPRDGTKYWSNNAAMVIMDYLTRTTGSTGNTTPVSMGLDYNPATNTSADIDITNFAAAANICDQPVALLDGSTEARYTIDGIISMGDNPIDILTLMVPHTGGTFTYFDWQAKLFPAAYSPPTANVDVDWLTSSIVYNESNDKQTLSNTVKAIFNDEANLYYPDDIPQYQNPIFLAQDNGQELSEDLQLPYIKNTQKAQRLAKLYLEQKRATRKQYTVKMNPRGAALAPYDTIGFTYPRRNIINQTFKVLTHSESLLDGTMDVILRPEDPSFYEWQANEAST